MKKIIAGTIGAGLLAGALWFPVEETTDWRKGYPPCATEDSNGPCYWDANKQGNGQGRSFVVELDNRVSYRAAHGKIPWCQLLSRQPAYHYYYQGARVDVPAGKRIIKMEKPTKAECKALVKEYIRHG